jgi:hypothetical protein
MENLLSNKLPFIFITIRKSKSRYFCFFILLFIIIYYLLKKKRFQTKKRKHYQIIRNQIPFYIHIIIEKIQRIRHFF